MTTQRYLVASLVFWLGVAGACGPKPPPVIPPPPPPPPPVPIVLERLVPADNRFILEGGGEILLIGINAHQMQEQFLNDHPEYEAKRDQLIAEGFNVFRVFSMVFCEDEVGSVWQGRLHPCDLLYDDAYYAAWTELARDLAQHRAYLHIDVFACAERLMPVAQRQEHYRRVVEAVRGETNVLLSKGNELDNSCNAIDQLEFPNADGVLSSSGSNGGRQAPPRPWDEFEEYHSNQSPEPQREAHNAMEFNQGDAEGHIAPSRLPIVMSEMPRPDQMGGLYRYYDNARASILLIATSYYHCDRCRFAETLDGDDLAGAREHVAGARSMPLACQTAGGYDHGQAMIDLEIAEGLLRAYRRGTTDDACIVKIRH